MDRHPTLTHPVQNTCVLCDSAHVQWFITYTIYKQNWTVPFSYFRRDFVSLKKKGKDNGIYTWKLVWNLNWIFKNTEWVLVIFDLSVISVLWAWKLHLWCCDLVVDFQNCCGMLPGELKSFRKESLQISLKTLKMFKTHGKWQQGRLFRRQNTFCSINVNLGPYIKRTLRRAINFAEQWFYVFIIYLAYKKAWLIIMLKLHDHTESKQQVNNSIDSELTEEQRCLPFGSNLMNGMCDAFCTSRHAEAHAIFW